METVKSTAGPPSRSVDPQSSSEGLGPTSEPFPSSDGTPRSPPAASTAAATAATAAVSTANAAASSAKTPAPYSERSLLMAPSSDSLLGEPSAGPSFTHKTGQERLGFEPAYVSSGTQDPCTSNYLSSSPGPLPGSSSGPASRPSLGCGHDPELSPYTHPSLTNPGADLVPPWSHHTQWEPQKQQPWKFLQVSEPGARGLWKPPEVEGKHKVLDETLPRGQCLLYNWEEERATNHLDRVPSMQDGSESFFFRHGHQGLLSLQLQSPMPCSTSQTDSYQPPGNRHQPIRGKREAMLEMLLRHQICKEVQAEQEPTRENFEVESVTHHDYRKELAQAGPPAPTKPHDYYQEQPETFWIQRAPQLPGVSNIKTLDTPFRKNCSFSTPITSSLGQPLPYEPGNYSHQVGEISSLACQGGGQGGGGGRTTPV
ncbi:sperm-associated antigen 8 isoform X3 [Equus asinus]|uniref:Sperm associated antigen 8 n=1 Tax=Equus asinus TaxID=9793 RepID=A0A9L0IE12_EQUAS|nr:sperm-associated antigen 8 isoform X1 [Equus asinus]XP_046527243.1 sperm-associated antigen 8 isoform X2 [Equus quagga]